MTALLLFITGILAGGIGAMLGLGGGIIVIPLLTMFFGLPIHSAIAVSLVGVVATSTGAALVHMRAGMADLRLGMLMELGTTAGAVLGALAAGYVSARALYLLFALLLAYNAYAMYPRKTGSSAGAGPSAETAMSGERGTDFPDYEVRHIPAGLSLSALAGALSSLLGIGGGIIKVPVMHLLMGIPLKVATATSNLMIGITAATGGIVYFMGGRINPAVAAPVALGGFIGAMGGAWVNKQVSTATLKKIFVLVLIYISIQMVLKGLRG